MEGSWPPLSRDDQKAWLHQKNPAYTGPVRTPQFGVDLVDATQSGLELEGRRSRHGSLRGERPASGCATATELRPGGNRAERTAKEVPYSGTAAGELSKSQWSCSKTGQLPG